jgi:hypothetical protein
LSELDLDLGALGWSDELAESLQPGCTPGRVVAAHRAAFDVATGGAVVRTRLPGRLAHFDVTDVAVGDWVGLRDGLIRSVLPRRSALVRSAAGLTSDSQTLAANVDVTFVVTSFGPDLEPRRLERYLVTIWESGASPEIVLTKADRFADVSAMVAEVEAVAVGAAMTRCATPLGRFELEQLKLVAVVTGLDDPVAMVEAPGGVGYSMKRGTCVGRNGGVVAAVRSGEVVVAEWAIRADGTRDRTRTILRLPKEPALNLEE